MKPVHTSSVDRLLVLSLLALLVAGCGRAPRKAIYPVQGTVTFDGAPLTEGRIVFEAVEQGISAMASLDENGQYVLLTPDGKGLPAGTYLVSFTPPKLDVPPGPIPPDIQQRMDSFPLPDKYLAAKTSGLSIQVNSEKSLPFDFALQKP